MTSSTESHRARLAGVVGLVYLLAWMGTGCADSQRQIEADSVPFELYDSPLLASNVTATDHTSDPFPGHSNSTSPSQPPSRSRPSEETNPKAESNDANAPELGSVEPGSGPGSAEANPDAARYVHAVYRANRIELPEETKTDVSALYRECRERNAISMSGRPAAGDIVFFHNTTDANGDGRNNDWYTYAALVEHPNDGGRVELLGYRDGDVRSFRMNRHRPESSKANVRLRAPSDRDPPFTRYRAGQLFAGYCSLLGNRREFIAIDNWEPGMAIDPPDAEQSSARN